MGFLFSNPLLLAGLIGLGLPIALHLLLKRRNQRLRFSTNRFFAVQDDRSSRRRRLRNLLLLSLRLLIFALLVLAFARPFLPLTGAAARDARRQQVVLLVDHSLSLSALHEGRPRWEHVRSAADAWLRKLSSDDRVAVVDCNEAAPVSDGFTPPSVAVAKLADMAPTAGGAELGNGLRQAVKLMESADPKLARTIVVLSDLQRTGTLKLPSAQVPPGVEVKTLAAGDLVTPNLGVLALDFDATGGRLPQATLASYSDEGKTDVESEWAVDGQVLERRLVTLGSGATAPVEFNATGLKPGWHTLEFRIRPRGSDALAGDNVRYQTIFVPEPLRVLSVEERGGRRSFEAETFFVNTAMEASAGSGTNAAAAFRVLRATPTDAVNMLTAAGAKGRSVDVVILASGRTESEPLSRALAAFVQGGGGLLMTVGDGLTPLRWNNRMAGLVPANLKTVETAGVDHPWRLGELDGSSPYFSLFSLPSAGDPDVAEYTRRYKLDVLAGASVVARFDDGEPFAVARELGAGRVLLLNTSADTAWNDWPKHKSFVPWLHRALRHLGQRGAEEVLRAGTELPVGAVLDPGTLALGASVETEGFQVVGPGNEIRRVKPLAGGRWPDVVLDKPGAYRLVDTAGRELRRVAVNVPAAESDLAAWRPREFEEKVSRTGSNPAASLVGNLLGNDRNQREFWRVLMLGVLALLILETIWSNRSYT